MGHPAIGKVCAPVARSIVLLAPFTMKSVAGVHFLDPARGRREAGAADRRMCADRCHNGFLGKTRAVHFRFRGNAKKLRVF
jgi:hypothetical protein